MIIVDLIRMYLEVINLSIVPPKIGQNLKAIHILAIVHLNLDGIIVSNHILHFEEPAFPLDLILPHKPVKRLLGVGRKSILQ